MTYETILADIEDGVGILTLNRPEKLNAMNRKLGSELHDALKRFEADDAVGCIVLTGAGRAFSAGGDIHEQLEDDARHSDDELDRMRERRHYLDISISKKPTIGMMNGLAFGGAAVLSSSLDMRIGCEHTKFRFLAAAYGRINSTWTLPNRSDGRWPRSSCSRPGWSRPRRPTASACSITSCHATSCVPRRWNWQRPSPATTAPR